MSAVNTNCVLAAKTKDWEGAEKWIRDSDDLSRRLEVGVYLRKGNVTDFHSMKAKAYREKLETLKMLVEARNDFEIKEKAMDVSRSFQSLHRAFETLE